MKIFIIEYKFCFSENFKSRDSNFAFSIFPFDIALNKNFN